MMEAVRTSETSVDIDLTIRQYILEDSELQSFVPFHMGMKLNVGAGLAQAV
jgi:hypothetical protein